MQFMHAILKGGVNERRSKNEKGNNYSYLFSLSYGHFCYSAWNGEYLKPGDNEGILFPALLFQGST